ncbi:PstS family phosphate ABC transporter substrate-binding protein [Streptomyces sp. CA-253872]|uniref:PstS family phosphate ABC transporter substrate-binding protein n=1 Tax=Streptomyces sp. CA-253872 TaxID=3240067 RepID=UPI003D8D2368
MDWFSAENVVAIGTAVLGVGASVVLLWYERRVPRRRHIGYRVQVDMPIRARAGSGTGGRVTPGSLGLLDGLGEDGLGEDGDGRAAHGRALSLVLLRVENDGAQFLDSSHYTGHELHGLTAEFTGRRVRGLDVTQRPGSDHLATHFTPGAGLAWSEGTLKIPRVPLGRGEYYKLLVLLDGGSPGDPVTVRGGLLEGRVTPNRALSPDDTPPLLSRWAWVIISALTAFVCVLATLILLPDERLPIGCATGRLTVTGSTAFAPAVRGAARAYEKECPGAEVDVVAAGSGEGIETLTERGLAAKGRFPSVIAFSDGPAIDAAPELSRRPVALTAFTLVVNAKLGRRDLTPDEIRAIFRGDVTNWKQLKGWKPGTRAPDLPITVVSRTSGSGTRATFEHTLLHKGEGEPAVTAPDCRTRTNPRVRLLRCERPSTEALLRTVAETPGAIGYAERRTDTLPREVRALTIGGTAPTAGTRDYPFTAVEYAYTYGTPPETSPAAGFLDYLTTGPGTNAILRQRQLPCAEPESGGRCGVQGAG